MYYFATPFDDIMARATRIPFKEPVMGEPGFERMISHAKSSRVLVEEVDLGWRATSESQHVSKMCDSEANAWLFLMEALVIIKPGETVFISPEFGETPIGTVILPSRGPAQAVLRSRIEIRRFNGHFHLFRLDRRYAGQFQRSEARDLLQLRITDGDQPLHFKTLGGGAEHADQYIYECTSDRAAAA